MVTRGQLSAMGLSRAALSRLQSSRRLRRRSKYPAGGLWGYNDNDHAHRHRPEDDEEKSETVRSYRRRPAP